MTRSPLDLLPPLRAAWSPETSGLWDPENPARGQCDVTALAVHELFGGDILKTEVPEGWHFYNRVDGVRYDLTQSQFDRPIAYADVPSNRREALARTLPGQYEALKRRLEERLRA